MAAPHWAETYLKLELGAPGTAVQFGAAILNSVSAHIAVLDRNGVIVATNEAWRQFASENGLTEDFIECRAGIGANYLEVCRRSAEHFADSAEALKGIRGVLDRSLRSFSMEYSCHSPDSERWFSMSVTPLTISEVCGAVVLHSDITERKQADQSRFESEQRISRFMEHIPGLAWIKDAQGRYVEVSESTAQAIGRTRAFMQSRTDYDVMPRSTADQFREADLRVLATGECMQFEESLETSEGLRNYIVNKFPIPSKPGDAPLVAGVAIDITDWKRQERELRETQHRMARLLQHANIGVWDWNCDTYETVYSREWKSQLGYAEDEIVDHYDEWESRVHPDDRAHALAKLNEVAKRGEGFIELEFRMRHKNGSWRWILSRGTFLPSSGCRPTRLAGIHVDITELKQTEAALRGQLRILERIATGDPLAEVLGEIVAHVNRQIPEYICTILLLSEDGKTVQEGAAGNLPPELSEAIARIRSSLNVGACGIAARLKETIIVTDIAIDPLWHGCRDLALKSGLRSYWSAPITAGGQSMNDRGHTQVLGVFALYGREPSSPGAQHLRIMSAAANLAGIAIERHRNEDAIRDSEDRLRTLLENLENVAVQAFEPTGKVTFWNKASERLYGYSAAEAMGKDIIQLLHTPNTQSYERRLIAQALGGGQLPQAEEIEVVRQDSTVLTIFTKRILHRRPGRPLEFFRFDIDRTDRRRAEQELALRQSELLHTSRLSTLGQMVAALSHELAQPLTAIGNYASASRQLIDKTPPATEMLCNFIAGIDQQSQRCITILQRLRDFSRRAPPSRTSCDISQLVLDSVELMATELRRQNVALSTELAKDLPLVPGDRILIEQVIVNVLTNALDAVRDQPSGNRLVTIQTQQCEQNVCIVVRDSGRGLTPEAAARLFEPFYTTKPEGMGIGLNICDSIIRQHGGQIEARNHERGGAVFTIRLPFSNGTQAWTSKV